MYQPNTKLIPIKPKRICNNFVIFSITKKCFRKMQGIQSCLSVFVFFMFPLYNKEMLQLHITFSECVKTFEEKRSYEILKM